MAKLGQKQIREAALVIVGGTPGGIRYSELIRRIQQLHPETPRNTIVGSIWNLERVFPDRVAKPSRGLFVPVRQGNETVEPAGDAPAVAAIEEADFYAPFAEWLRDDLGEVTTAVALGGSALRSKSGTPDVVGVFKPTPSDLIKFPAEVVSGELKISTNSPVEAFGQAATYRLFSAKNYVAVPNTLTEVDKSRLEALCIPFGIGLVLFDADRAEPNFSIRVRAQRFSPDMFYVNEFAEGLRKHDRALFNTLFA